jgi:hypothetical protein
MNERSTNNINRGSEKATTEMENSGIANRIASVPSMARIGDDDKYLNKTIPARYTINPKMTAFTTGAVKSGSVPKILLIIARIPGYRGGHRVNGSPSNETNPPPVMRLRAVEI